MSGCSRTLTIRNRRGLHARASAKLVGIASTLPATVWVEKDGHAVTGTSIMGLMMLGAAMGDTITIRCEGDDCAQSLDALAALVEDKFGED